jgi:hypothetical protein
VVQPELVKIFIVPALIKLAPLLALIHSLAVINNFVIILIVVLDIQLVLVLVKIII